MRTREDTQTQKQRDPKHEDARLRVFDIVCDRQALHAAVLERDNRVGVCNFYDNQRRVTLQVAVAE